MFVLTFIGFLLSFNFFFLLALMHLSNASEVPKVTGWFRHFGLADFVLKIKEIGRIGSIGLWIYRLLPPSGPNHSVWSTHVYARNREAELEKTVPTIIADARTKPVRGALHGSTGGLKTPKQKCSVLAERRISKRKMLRRGCWVFKPRLSSTFGASFASCLRLLFEPDRFGEICEGS